jgi:hypothetical protein
MNKLLILIIVAVATTFNLPGMNNKHITDKHLKAFEKLILNNPLAPEEITNDAYLKQLQNLASEIFELRSELFHRSKKRGWQFKKNITLANIEAAIAQQKHIALQIIVQQSSSGSLKQKLEYTPTHFAAHCSVDIPYNTLKDVRDAVILTQYKYIYGKKSLGTHFSSDRHLKATKKVLLEKINKQEKKTQEKLIQAIEEQKLFFQKINPLDKKIIKSLYDSLNPWRSTIFLQQSTPLNQLMLNPKHNFFKIFGPLPRRIAQLQYWSHLRQKCHTFDKIATLLDSLNKPTQVSSIIYNDNLNNDNLKE